jgi:hypothetical protein
VTLEELYDPAMTAQTQEEADAHLERIVAHLSTLPDAPVDEAQLLELARGNLGYWSGYYSAEVAARVEQLYGAIHPYLGPMSLRRALTPEDILRTGQRLGEEIREEEERRGG